MPDTGGPDISSLVAEATKGHNPPQVCWYNFAPQGVREFVDALIAHEAENPHSVNRTESRRIIKREYGFDVSKGKFDRHFRGECSTCERE